ncbi:MlaD family protein [Amycolatopsis sp. SID8362]|uniref:MlaD family protein n=1 Tax=Amycolatopsis sp. SID8362 TaxID=2690346 RepID=UPI00136B4BB9|nr:MlaD family protein [Amycolatopsis sp. SID8362]NBH07489.1 MCE family protein [Amycolatopsis sp. SID8362]NED44185.1 MCE family protein [Amycolatopsis sp. SID8362]
MKRALTIGVVAVAVLGAGTAAAAMGTDDYQVGVLLDSATNVVPGGTVQVNGFEVGSVSDISVESGKAKLVLSLEGDHVPLHDGAVVRIEWKAALGERMVNITDGPGGNAAIPDGGLIKGEMPVPMEFDQVLAALDAPTRAKLSSLINRLDSTVKGNEADLNRTVRSAGPAVAALGEVLRGLGSDGPAIKQMVSQLDTMVGTLAGHEADLRTVVDQLSKTTSLTAEQHQALAAVLAKLPGTLRTAGKTLGDVPGAVDKAVPLLKDLEPATAKLPDVSRDLRPVLTDLRPLVAELRPTLTDAQALLNYTPGLLDTAHATVPGLNAAVTGLLPALSFLRPFTPEAAGLLANWGSANANYDSNGHYSRIFVQAGAGSLNVNPGIVPPGVTKNPTPLPGSPVGQPWTDAFGSGIR